MALNYEHKLQTFISNNEDLVNEYESNEINVPLEYCLDDIVSGFQSLQKIQKGIDFNQALYEAISNSIKYNININESFESLIFSCKDSLLSNSTQQYFKEINDIYNRNNNEYDIEYCPKNRDKLIEMNLKTVISIAKKYQGLGLSLQELISAGNLGLVIAWDKYDPNRSKLKDDILECISFLNESFTFEELEDCIRPYLNYGDIKKKFYEKFDKHNHSLLNKKDVIKWVNCNIYNAKFNSIATMWIKAYILIEIDNNSRIVKKPKSEIYKDREKYGAYKKEITVDIDAPVSEDTDTCLSDILYIEDDTQSDLEVSEAYDIFKGGLNKLLEGVKNRDRSIFLKKFGIGLPRPMLPKEIAEQEGLSIARISQIFQTVIEQMQKNQVKYDIDPDILFDAIKKIY